MVVEIPLLPPYIAPQSLFAYHSPPF